MHINIKEKLKDKIFFTSDTHFGHANIIKYCDRPFDDVEEMDKAMIKWWNEKIPKDGIVFHLGDFAMSNSVAKKIYPQLNGNIIMAKGNHDRYNFISMLNLDARTALIRGDDAGVEWKHPFYMLEIIDLHVEDSDTDNLGMRFALCHYPLGSWNYSGFGAVNLYGHVHTNPSYPSTYKPSTLQYDVGADNNSYVPVSYNELVIKFTKQFLKGS